MYQVIARKWRPQRFEEVTGQEPITRTLQNAVRMGRLHHAYLFSGPRGCGKTTTARILAKALNCFKGTVAEPCLECPSCTEIAAGGSLDVLEIDAASNTGVDNVRDVIINTIAVNPARDRYKVFIIDEVHMLSMSAFNALLKTLEEPPPHAVFILATTELHKVPQTILSRCQQFEFRTIASDAVAERLKLIAEADNISVSDKALHQIAVFGQGSMRDAQSAFDQIISFAGQTITDEDVRSALGIINLQTLHDFTRAVAEGDGKRILELVRDLSSAGYDLRQFCRDLMLHFRNLLVLKTVGYDREILPIVESELDEYQSQASRFSSEDLTRFFSLLTALEQEIKLSTQPRHQLEIGLVKLVQVGKLQTLEELLQRLEALDARISGEGSAAIGSSSTAAPRAATKVAPPPAGLSAPPPKPIAPAKTSGPPPASQPASQLGAGSGGGENPHEPPPDLDYESAADLRENKTAAGISKSPVERLRSALAAMRGQMMLNAALDAAEMQIENDRLIIRFEAKKTELYKKASSKESRKTIEDAARGLFGKDLKIEIVIDDGSTGQQGDAVEEELRRKAEADPTVQLIKKKFKGELSKVEQLDD